MKQIAVVNYGWESRKFYIDWFREDDKEVIDELKGPSLNTMSPQSEYAPYVLEAVSLVLRDKAYVERLKRHYRLFKEVVDNNAETDKEYGNITILKPSSISRNDPCPCGSGKKYKKCCLK